MDFCDTGLVAPDHFVLCKVALVFGMTRWIFFWVQRLLKHYMCLFENEPLTQTKACPCSLALARENLSLTTFGGIADRLPKIDSHKMSCAVCLKRFRKSNEVWELRNCNHVFHKQCLDRWLQYDSRMTCPLCRTCLISASSEPSSMQQQQQPSWAVERILYLFGDDLPYSCSYSSS